jgi:pyruvate dehydrogenase E2 component (dihydrolipoamide acetyltransferase)
MATNVLLPQWGMNMEDGTLVKWLVKEGDEVEKGQPLVEVETAKINSDLESPVEGIVSHLMSDEGAIVKVGTLVAVIGEPGENPPRPELIPTRARRSTRTQPEQSSRVKSNRRTQITPIARKLARENSIDTDSLLGTGPQGRITEDDVRKVMTNNDVSRSANSAQQVVPRARQLARDNDVDLDSVTGTGPNGRVVVADVEREIRSAVSPTNHGGTVSGSSKLSGLRKIISDRMTSSVQTMAQVTLTTEIDATNLIATKESLVSPWRPHKIRPMEQDIVVSAVGEALTQHERLNSHMQGDTVKLFREVNIGVAMAVPDGLVVPVVHMADKTSLLDIARRLRELAIKARNNSLNIRDVSGAGFTITSLANYDIDVFTPIVDPPQVAIMGTGRISKKPVIVEDKIIPRHTMHISVTFDHRALDGVPVAEFIRTVKSYLESEQWLSRRSEG